MKNIVLFFVQKEAIGNKGYKPVKEKIKNRRKKKIYPTEYIVLNTREK